MTISTTTSKDQHNGNDSATTFNYNFKILDQSHLEVIKTSTAGVDSTLTITTDYTVSGVGDDSGSISYPVTGSPLATGEKLTIRRKQDFLQSVDLQNQGGFFAEVHEEAFDKQAMFALQNQEELDRTLRAPVTDPTTVDMTLPTKAARLGTVLGFNATTGDPEAGPEIADVSTLASITSDIATLADIEDGTDATDAIQTVAGISSNVSTVAGISANVTTVAGISSDVTSVAADATDIGTVSTNIASVNTVATNIADVVTVADDLNEAISEIETAANDLNEATSEIDTVATNIANVNTVGGISSDVTTVAGISFNVSTVAGISSNVTTVAGDSTEIGIVAGDTTEIGIVAGDTTEIGVVAGDTTEIGVVAGISSDVTTVAGISSYVTAVAGDATDIGIVAGDSTEIGIVAGDTTEIGIVAGDTTEIGTVAGISSNISTVAGISSNVTTVAGISGNVTTVAGDSSDIGTVAGISSNVTTVAGISSNVSTVAGDSTEIGVVAGDTTNIGTVASNIAGVNSFAERYRVASSAPVSDLDEGDLYFNTTDNKLYHYNGSAWVEITAYSHPTGAGNEHLPSAVSQTEAGYLNGVTSDIQTQLDAKVAKTSSTGSGVLPAGTTAQRDGSPSAGYLRFNTTDTSAEIYDGSAWAAVGGGNSTDKGLYEHAHTISADYTITSGNNALTAGPITIDSGYSVTIPTGSTWVVA